MNKKVKPCNIRLARPKFSLSTTKMFGCLSLYTDDEVKMHGKNRLDHADYLGKTCDQSYHSLCLSVVRVSRRSLSGMTVCPAGTVGSGMFRIRSLSCFSQSLCRDCKLIRRKKIRIQRIAI